MRMETSYTQFIYKHVSTFTTSKPLSDT